MARLTATGSRAMGRCPAPDQGQPLTAGHLGDQLRPGRRLAAVAVAVHDEHRAPDPLQDGQRLLAVVDAGMSGVAGEQLVGGGLQGPADAVLDHLRRVRLGDALAEEELHPAAEVLAQVPVGDLGPPLHGAGHLVGGVLHPRRQRRDQGTAATGQRPPARPPAPGLRRPPAAPSRRSCRAPPGRRTRRRARPSRRACRRPSAACRRPRDRPAGRTGRSRADRS